MFVRKAGWETRLAAVVADARKKPYVLGSHDCFRFSCAAVEALTGKDLWPQWAGKYRTKTQALRLIVEYGGDFTSAFTKLFGTAPAPMASANRGDIAEYVCAGEQHLGVVTGATVALLCEVGVMPLPRRLCNHCWRIG